VGDVDVHHRYNLDVDLLFMSAYLGELSEPRSFLLFVIRAIWLFPIPWRDCWVPRVLIGLKNARYTCSFPFLSFLSPFFLGLGLWAGTWDLGLGGLFARVCGHCATAWFRPWLDYIYHILAGLKWETGRWYYLSAYRDSAGYLRYLSFSSLCVNARV
jgi:hypothetical protein